jgi:hypothetical protein
LPHPLLITTCSCSMLRKRPDRNTAARYPSRAGFSLSHATPPVRTDASRLTDITGSTVAMVHRNAPRCAIEGTGLGRAAYPSRLQIGWFLDGARSTFRLVELPLAFFGHI